MKKVLVIDDSETVRQQVALALRGTVFTVVQAPDGIDGLARAFAERDISLVLLDLNMPRMNGLDVLDRLRADPRTRDLPVLILTTEVERHMIERAKKAGAKAWLIKPVKPQMLVEVVTKLCLPDRPRLNA